MLTCHQSKDMVVAANELYKHMAGQIGCCRGRLVHVHGLASQWPLLGFVKSNLMEARINNIHI